MAIEIKGAAGPRFDEILTDAALEFVADLHRTFDGVRQERLAARMTLQADLDAGAKLGFPPETAARRADASWKIAGIPADIADRRVEITGPTDRKMVINALNAGAKTFMACLEDASSPTWENMVDGQLNLKDAIDGSITLVDENSGKSYALGENPATLIVRPRGWHLLEKHMLVDGEPVAGALFDFGLYFFHNARRALERGTRPYFYLAKMEHYLEAKLWSDVMAHGEDALGLPRGTAKATVLIETIPAAFHAEDILYEMRDHIIGLNCGRWDYIFSYIKRHRNDPTKVLPDRAAVTMTSPFMRAYSLHVIRTCHKRGAFAMGGMAAQIPIKGDEAANNAAFEKVRADKLREATDGHDGTWVAHPGLVQVALEVFDKTMPEANQIDKLLDGEATEAELLEASEGPKTMDGLRMNVNVGIGYLAAWLNGRGAVPLHNLMEDAATAEISRTQVWQWRRHGVKLDSGEIVTDAIVRQAVANELDSLKQQLGEDGVKAGKYREAAELMEAMMLADECPEFLTIPAYDRYFAPAA